MACLSKKATYRLIIVSLLVTIIIVVAGKVSFFLAYVIVVYIELENLCMVTFLCFCLNLSWGKDFANCEHLVWVSNLLIRTMLVRPANMK